MAGYIKTDTVLDKILANTEREMAARKSDMRIQEVMNAAHIAAPPRDAINVLRQDTVALIAEVKKASPSRGVLVKNFDPVHLGRIYDENGAAAISVLTDEKFFKGSLDYLTAVRDTVNVPVLRKDFIIDAYQIYEGRSAGADIILLIVAALDDTQLHDLYNLVLELGMEALVEVHNEDELKRALKLNPRLLGVNNRDLKTFSVDLDNCGRLIAAVDTTEVTFVAESGIKTTDDIKRMGDLGAHAVLVGETLVTAADPAATVRAFSTQVRAK